MDKAKLEALLERVEKATVPDRELDCRLSHHLERMGIWYGTGDDAGFAPAETVDGWDDVKWHEVGQDHVSGLVPLLTSSIDAALALVGRVLPEDHSVHMKALRHMATATVWIENVGHRCSRPTLPLAILAALLKALIALEAACAS